MQRLANKNALITGGTTGIGLATAKLFAAEGARVTITGTNPRTLEAARAALGDQVRVVASNAGSPDDVAELAALFATSGLDVAFLNAGVVPYSPIAETDPDVVDEAFRVNFKGPWLAIKHLTPHLRPGASVVLNGSIVAHMGGAGSSVYSATKAAVRSLGRTAAAELAAAKIRVNVLSPGPTDSGVLEKSGASAEQLAVMKQNLIERVPQQRLGLPEEIARAALFLASDDSSFMTGSEVMVDGGWTGLSRVA
jgi:NAD(P)-dependent dehydrogenase (short-subunit alcohol dehydrogenase family)